MQKTEAGKWAQVTDKYKIFKRHADCYIKGASDVPADPRKGQPKRTADTLQEPPPTKRPFKKKGNRQGGLH
jgi:hypothetical protein